MLLKVAKIILVGMHTFTTSHMDSGTQISWFPHPLSSAKRRKLNAEERMLNGNSFISYLVSGDEFVCHSLRYWSHLALLTWLAEIIDVILPLGDVLFPCKCKCALHSGWSQRITLITETLVVYLNSIKGDCICTVAQFWTHFDTPSSNAL